MCGNVDSIALLHGSARRRSGVVFRTPEQLGALARVLERVGVDRADVHHVIGFETEAENLLRLLRLSFDVTMVDYHLVATNPHLCFADGVFVGDDRLAEPECGLLRAEPVSLVCKADRVIAISRDMAARIKAFFPHLSVIAARHWRERSSMRVRHVFAPRVWDNEPLRVLVAGWIVENKGRQVILDATRIVHKRRLPVRFHVLGEMELGVQDVHELGDVITLHGRFPTERFSEMVGAIAPHVAWLPAQVPETWSYVLTDFIEAALPVAATAIGAIPERCDNRPFTWLLQPDSQAQTWVTFFLALHASNLGLPAKWSSIDHLPSAHDFYFEEYLALARQARVARAAR